MICKWCGNDIPNGNRNCPSCGKEQPPISECGGFFDLVPTAKAMLHPAPQSVPAQKEAVPTAVQSDRSEPQKRVNMVSLIGWIAFALALVMLIVLLITNAKNASRIEQLENELAMVQDTAQTEVTESSVPTDEQPSSNSLSTASQIGTETAEPSETTEPDPTDLLASRDLTITYFCDKEQTKKSDVDPEGLLDCEFEPVLQNDSITFSGTCKYEGADLCDVTYSITKDEPGTLKLVVSYNVHTDLGYLGTYQSGEKPITLLWKYAEEENFRTAEEAGLMIEEKDTSHDEIISKTYTINCDQKASKASANKIDVVFEIRRANTDGGKLSINIRTTCIDLSNATYDFKK